MGRPTSGAAPGCGGFRLRYDGAMTAAPVAPAERIETIDVVRGFALLGILLLNILAFGLPFRAYFDPTVDGATAGIDFAVYVGVELGAEGALRALFSILFGAGVVLFATGPRAKPAGIYYRRQFLLLAFGLFDAFVLLWTGDILILYALAGMALYPLRNFSAKALFATAALVFGYLLLFYGFMFMVLTELPAQAAAVEARIAAGEPVAAEARGVIDEWAALRANFYPPPDALANEQAKFGADYVAAFAANARELGALFSVYPLFFFWDALGCMVLGMALFKTGVLQGERSAAFYWRLAIAGVGVGVAVNAWEVAMKVGSGYAVQWVSGISVPTHDVGRVALALGYVGVIALVCRSGGLARVRSALAAVGRMALSNYILQSVVGLALFHGFALALWNELPRHQLYLVVLGEWLLAVLASVWWLRRHRFGPLEWLWRKLTYYGGGTRAKA